MLADFTPTALLASRAPTTVRTSAAHLALRAWLHPVLAWHLRRRDSLPLRALSLGRLRSVFPTYPIVVSGRLHLDIRDIVVGHFLLDGFDMLDQRVWAPDCGHGGGDTTARVNSDGKFEKYRPAKIATNEVSAPDRIGRAEVAMEDMHAKECDTLHG